jgi:hypothetical protein
LHRGLRAAHLGGGSPSIHGLGLAAGLDRLLFNTAKNSAGLMASPPAPPFSPRSPVPLPPEPLVPGSELRVVDASFNPAPTHNTSPNPRLSTPTPAPQCRRQ